MRNVRLIGVLLFFVLSLTGRSAWANEVTATIACSGVTYTFTHFAGKPGGSVDETVLIDGSPAATHTAVFTTEDGSDTVAITVPPGPHVITANAVWSNAKKTFTYTTSATLTCVPICVPGTANPAGANASGNAFGAALDLPVLGHIAPGRTVISTESGIGSSHDDNAATSGFTIPGVATANLLSVATTSTVSTTPSQADGSSFAETLGINLLNGVIKADVVRANAEAIATGDSSAVNSAGSTFANLVVAGKQFANVMPNTKISLPILGKNAFVVLYETIGSTSGPGPGQLSGGTYAADMTVNMIHVHIPGLLGLAATDIIVSHATAHADFPQTLVCTANAQAVSGHAFIASTNIDSPLDLSVVVGFSGIPSTGGGASQSLLTPTLPPALGTVGISSTQSTGALNPTNSTASSFAHVANASLLGGVVQATVINTQSNSLADGSGATSDSLGTQLVNIKVAGLPVANNPKPNTTITIPGIGFVIFNEQFPDGPAPNHSGLTVRAIHIHINQLAGVVPGADVIVAESHSDATF